MQTMTLTMPPSLNRYYRAVGGMVKLSADGRAYKETVAKEVREQCVMPYGGEKRLGVRVLVERADKRRADLDNTLKGLLDALEESGVYENDGQIDLLIVQRGEVRANARVEVEVFEVKPTARVGMWERLGRWMRSWLVPEGAAIEA